MTDDRETGGDAEDATLGERVIRHSIRPSTAVPPTVLVVEMGGGALFLQGWRTGPSAYLVAEDAVGLKRELAKAFGSADTPPHDR